MATGKPLYTLDTLGAPLEGYLDRLKAAVQVRREDLSKNKPIVCHLAHGAPASEALVAKVTAAIGFPVPADLLALMRQFNGLSAAVAVLKRAASVEIADDAPLRYAALADMKHPLWQDKIDWLISVTRRSTYTLSLGAPRSASSASYSAEIIGSPRPVSASISPPSRRPSTCSTVSSRGPRKIDGPGLGSSPPASSGSSSCIARASAARRWPGVANSGSIPVDRAVHVVATRRLEANSSLRGIICPVTPAGRRGSAAPAGCAARLRISAGGSVSDSAQARDRAQGK